MDALKLNQDTEIRVKALAKFLEVGQDEITQSRYDTELFEVGREQYLVLNGDEAEQRVSDYIKDTLWAFRPEFLAAHSILDAETIEIIQKAKHEDANDPLLATIEDFDHLVDDAISSDGRGHFLAQYDGHENEQDITLQDGTKLSLFIYRTN